MADWITAIATAVIGLAAIANVVVYWLLWRQTKASVDEMRETTEFLIMSEILKKFGPSDRSQWLEKMFPKIAKKYWNRV
jgi:hypothetical protein